MLKSFVWALPAAVLLATPAFSYPKLEAHICAIDLDKALLAGFFMR
jgi:hypothetical protein